jgi:hypothetical protein
MALAKFLNDVVHLPTRLRVTGGYRNTRHRLA